MRWSANHRISEGSRCGRGPRTISRHNRRLQRLSHAWIIFRQARSKQVARRIGCWIQHSRPGRLCWPQSYPGQRYWARVVDARADRDCNNHWRTAGWPNPGADHAVAVLFASDEGRRPKRLLLICKVCPRCSTQSQGHLVPPKSSRSSSWKCCPAMFTTSFCLRPTIRYRQLNRAVAMVVQWSKGLSALEACACFWLIRLDFRCGSEIRMNGVPCGS
jgi:hypothetical protein